MPIINDFIKNQTISPRKLVANRSNAQKSTGPTTPEGKRNSSRNAISHGLTARTVVIDSGHLNEDPAEFAALYSQLQEELQPVGIMEECLVKYIVSGIWKVERGDLAEAGEIRKQLHSSRHRVLTKRAEHYQVGAYSLSLDAHTNYLRSGPEALNNLIRTLRIVKGEVETDGAVSKKNLVKITSALGSDDGSLSARLSAQLRDKGESSMEPYLQMIDEEIANIEELRNEIEEEETLAEEAEMDSLAIPVGQVGNNIRRYEAANRRQLSRDYKELAGLQERRLESALKNSRKSGPDVPISTKRTQLAAWPALQPEGRRASLQETDNRMTARGSG